MQDFPSSTCAHLDCRRVSYLALVPIVTDQKISAMESARAAPSESIECQNSLVSHVAP